MTTINNEYKYKIDKGIKIPDKRHGSKAYNLKYPVREMEVGDSFLVPYSHPESRRVKYHVYHMGKRLGNGRFTARNMATGVRVWRIK